MLTMDLSGLDVIIDMCDNVKTELPKMDAEYLQREWYKFLDFVLEYIPYDTGNMANSFKMSDILQKNGLTEADWENIAEYASFNNYGFTHYWSGNFIDGVFWWEGTFALLKTDAAKRYSEMLKNLMEMR